MDKETTSTTAVIEEPRGEFFSSLTRSNSRIKKDRAMSIAEEAEMLYRQAVQQKILDVKKLKRERENLLDMSPENSLTLKPAQDFDSKEFAAKHMNLTIRIYNAEKQLELHEEQFKKLFGMDV